MIEALDTHLENVNTKCELIDINNYKNNWHKVLIIPLSELFNFGLKRNEIMILGGDPEQKMHKNEVKSYQGASQMSHPSFPVPRRQQYYVSTSFPILSDRLPRKTNNE